MKILAVILVISLGINFYLYKETSELKKTVKDKEFVLSELQDKFKNIKQVHSKKLGNFRKQINESHTKPVQPSIAKPSKTENNNQNNDNLEDESPIVDVEQTGSDYLYAEIEKEAEEARENYNLAATAFFEQDLQLPNNSFKAYQEKVKEYEEQSSKIYQAVHERNKKMFGEKQPNGQDVPFIMSYEDEKKLNDLRDSMVKDMETSLGKDKVKRIMEFEREMKIKMIMENGYYNTMGLF